MATKGIPFNTEMVRALLDGRKTCTRRVVKPQPLWFNGRHYCFADETCPKKWEECDDFVATYQYQPGDILYVPEAWKCFAIWNDLGYEVEFRDGETVFFRFQSKDRADKWAKYLDKPKNNWQSPYFMPREAARIFLRVTDVRVERLHEMEDQDVLREAFENPGDFIRLWDSTIKPADLDRYGWAANPWVWVIEFERCEKPEEDA